MLRRLYLFRQNRVARPTCLTNNITASALWVRVILGDHGQNRRHRHAHAARHQRLDGVAGEHLLGHEPSSPRQGRQQGADKEEEAAAVPGVVAQVADDRLHQRTGDGRRQPIQGQLSDLAPGVEKIRLVLAFCSAKPN